MKLLAAAGIELPSGTLVFAPRTVLVSLGVGTLIALLASLRPAMRATRIEPIAAVREGSVMPASRFARYAVSLGVPSSPPPSGSSPTASSRADWTSSSGSSRSCSASCCCSSASRWSLRVSSGRSPRARHAGSTLGGAAGKLARQNAVRNPKRTASTAAAVMIGLALITFVAVIGQGVRTSFTGAVNELFVADYAVSTGRAGLEQGRRRGGRDPRRRRLRAPWRRARVGGKTSSSRGVDANLPKIVNLTWQGGTGNVPAQLGKNGAFVTDRYAKDHSLPFGSPVSQDADREGRPPPGRGDPRPAQGRLALRRGDGLEGTFDARSPTTTTS